MNKARDLLRFRIELLHISPAIFREILLPAKGTFWDLHVAIQDSMGWLDCHLHGFRPANASPDDPVIGLPTDWDAIETLPGWHVDLADHFSTPGDQTVYTYDFGDDWDHEVTLLGIEPRVKGGKYPQCVDGARTCPPEDCGGVPGYYDLLDVIFDPTHEDYQQTNEWIPTGWMPELFSRKDVKFRNANRRLNNLLDQY